MTNNNKNTKKTVKDTKRGTQLVSLLTGNETVYRTWRTFLQAAVGAAAAGLVELMSGVMTGDSPGKILLYFIMAAVAAGLSAVMNRSGAKPSAVEEEILQQLTEGLSALDERPEETGRTEGSNGES